MATFGSLSIVPWILFAQSSWNMDAVPVITAARPQEAQAAVVLRDRGEVFGRAAEQRVRESLLRGLHRHRTPILVETVRSLDGAWIADVAQRRAKLAGANRLYILVAGAERDVGVVGALHGPASRLTDQQREAIRRSFLGPLRAGEADMALERGVGTIETTLADAPRTQFTRWDAAILIAILSAVLAALLAPPIWSWYRGRSRRRHGIAATPTVPAANLLPRPLGRQIAAPLLGTATLTGEGRCRACRSQSRGRERMEA